MTAAPLPSVEGELMRGGYAGSGREDRQSVAGKRASQRLCGRYRGRGVRTAVIKPVKEPDREGGVFPASKLAVSPG